MPERIEVLSLSEFETLLAAWTPARRITEVHVHCTDHPRHAEFRGRASVEAMRAYQRGGGRHLFFGVPVGMPGETRALFEENAGFVEWALGLPGVVDGVTILPYMFFLQGQDPTFREP